MLYDPKWTPPATEIKLEKWQQALLDAADILEQKGWIQNHLGNAVIGYCTIGAIYAVPQQNNEECRLVCKKLENIVGDIAIWNDRCVRTKEEVVSTLREVANAV